MGEIARISTLPGTHIAAVPVDQAVALGSGLDHVVLVNKFGKTLVLTGFRFTPDAAVIGDDDDNFSLKAINKGSAGAGTTEMAAKEYATGVDLAAFVPDEVTLSTTEADLELDDGEVMTLAKVEKGSGLALPAGLVTITFKFK